MRAAGGGAGLLTRAPAALLCACAEALPLVLESDDMGRSERTDHGGENTGSGAQRVGQALLPASVGTGRLPRDVVEPERPRSLCPEMGKQLVKPGVLGNADTLAPQEGPCQPIAESGLYTNGEKMKTF